MGAPDARVGRDGRGDGLSGGAGAAVVAAVVGIHRPTVVDAVLSATPRRRAAGLAKVAATRRHPPIIGQRVR